MLRQQNQLRRKIVCVQFEMMWVKLMIAQSVVLGVGNRQKGTFILGFIAAAATTLPPPDYQLLVYAIWAPSFTTSLMVDLYQAEHKQLNCFP